MPDCYADGGEVEDDDMMLNHVALECMHAIESKDKDAFLDSFHVLVSDIVNKMQIEGDSDVNGQP
jgi:hypothetical protein